MNTATIASRYHFTVAEHERMTDVDVGRVRERILSANGERENRQDLGPWHECLRWQSDRSYQEMRRREEAGLPPLDTKSKKSRDSASPVPEPEPMLALPSRPQVVVRGGLTRADAKAIAGGVKSHLQKRYLTRDEVNSLFAAMSQRLRELEETVREMRQQNGRRFAESDQRHSQAARHRRNLESRLRGEPVERSPRGTE
jgi:hypothetical protein